MERFYVCRHYVKWKGQLYKKGDILPENFTERDRVRSVYSSRIARKDFPMSPEMLTQSQSQPPLTNIATPSTPPETPKKVVISKKGSKEADPKPSVNTPTGASEG